MNLASILITLTAKDDASNDVDKVIASLLGLGLASQTASVKMLAGFLGISGGALLMTAGVVAAAVAIKKAFDVLIDGFEMVGHAFLGSIKDAMAWEEAYAEVRKVIGPGDPGLKILEEQLLDLSTKLPVSTSELAKLAAVGAQMGIPTAHLKEFTEVAARLSATVDGVSAEQMATALGRLAGLTQSTTGQMRALASAVVKLSADTVANTDQIMRGALGFAGIAHQAGLTNAQIVALAATMASLDQRIERSSTAMYSMLRTFTLAAEDGGKKGAVFARVLGLTTEEFQKQAKANPSKVFEDFVLALGHSKKAGDDAIHVLKDLGFTGTKTGGIFIALSNNASALRVNLASANEEVLTQNALIEQSNTRWDTFASTMTLLNNAVREASIIFGSTFLPALNIVGRALEPVGAAIVAQAKAFKAEYSESVKESATVVATQFVPALVTMVEVAGETFDRFVRLVAESTKLNETFKALLISSGPGALIFSGLQVPLEDLLRLIPGVGNGLSDLVRKYKELAAADAEWKARVKPGSGMGHRAGGDEAPKDDPGQKGESPEEVALKSATKMSEKLREELDKLKDIHRNTYDKMSADIQRATDKRMLEAHLIKDVTEKTLKGLEAQIAQVAQAERNAAADAILLKEMGPPVGDAAKKWEELAGALQMANKTGWQPTREQLIKAYDDLKAFQGMTLTTFNALETKSPGAYQRLSEFFKKVSEATKTTDADWDSAFHDMALVTGEQLHNVEHWVGSGLAGFADMGEAAKKYGGTNEQSANMGLAVRREELNEQINMLTKQEKINKTLIDELKLKKALGEINDTVYAKALAGLEGTTKSTSKWHLAITGIMEAFKALGISSDSTFGRILASTNNAIQAYDKLIRNSSGQVIPFANQSSNQKIETATNAGVLAAATIVNIYTGSRNNDNAMGRTISGGIQGAEAGAVVGTAIEPGGGTLVGAVIGAVVGMAIAFFSGPPWHNAAKTAGQVFGFHVSDELAKAIYKDAGALGISLQSATLLHLMEGIKESGKTVADFQKQIGDLMMGVANGSIPAKQGIDQISQAFNAAKTEAAQSGDMINQTMLGMIMNARALGLEVASITQHIKDSLTLAVGGMNKLFSSRQKDDKGNAVAGGPNLLDVNTKQDAEAMALIFNTTFWGAVKEFGLIAAVDMLKAPFDALLAQLTAAGFDVEALFGDTLKIFKYASNEAFRGAAEAAVALKDGLVGIANAGMLSEAAFHAFGHAAKMGYDQAYAASGDANAAILSQLPLLAELKKAHDLYGYQLTDEEQKLYDQAVAAGAAFPTDPILQVRDAIYELITAITGIPRKVDITVNTNHTHTGDPGTTDPGPFNNDGSHDYNGDPNDSFAFGGYVPRQSGGRTVRVAERVGEYMVPEDMMKNLLTNAAMLGASGGGDNAPVHVHVHYPNGMIETIVTQGTKSGSVRVWPDAVRNF